MEWLNVIVEIVKWLSNRFKTKNQCPKEFLKEYRRAREYQWKAWKARSASPSVFSEDNGDKVDVQSEIEHDVQYLFEEARMAIRQAIRSGLSGAPDACMEEWFNAAALAEELEEPEYAARAYREVARRRHSERSVKATLRLAELSARQGRNAEALKLVKKILKSNPYDSEAIELMRELSQQEVNGISTGGD